MNSEVNVHFVPTLSPRLHAFSTKEYLTEDSTAETAVDCDNRPIAIYIGY